MEGSRLPRLALSAIGALALLACAEVVARVQGDRACLETPGAVIEAEPRFGWRYVPRFSGWVRSCSAPAPVASIASAVDVTEHGLLDLPRPLEKPPDASRILLLGGTLTTPLGLRQPVGLRPTSLSRLLEARADARRGRTLEVVDAATPGFALDNHLLYLRSEGMHFGPELVVLVIDPAYDVLALSPSLQADDEGGAPRKPYLELRDGLVQSAAPRPAREAGPLAHGGGRLGWPQLARSLVGAPARPESAPGRVAVDRLDERQAERERDRMRKLARALLSELDAEVKRAGARLAIAMAPITLAGERVDAAARVDARAIEDAARGIGIPLLSLEPAFAAFTRTSGRPAGHAEPRTLNPDGHFLAAEAIWGFLVREGLLPHGVVPSTVLEGGQVRNPRLVLRNLSDALYRDRHSLFLTFLQAGMLAACVVWIAAPLSPAVRDYALLGLGFAGAACLGSLRFAASTLGVAALVFAIRARLSARARALYGGGLLAALVVATSLWPALSTGLASSTSIELASFATNVALLRLLSHLAGQGSSPGSGPAPSVPLRVFLLSNLFFPTFINGPIQSPAEFGRARSAVGVAPEGWEALRAHLLASARALLRATAALVVLYAAWVVLNDKLRLDVFATGGTAVSRTRLWLWVGELYLLFYLSFAAWSTAAIALGRIVGVDVPPNFDRPWLALDVADFWRRWHITLGTWLRDSIYLPLGGARGGFARNVTLVFLASALWHVWGALKLVGPGAFGPRAWSGLLLWGAMNAAGVIASHRVGRSSGGSVVGVLVRRVLTTGFVALAWVPFFLPPGFGIGDCLAVFARLFFLR